MPTLKEITPSAEHLHIYSFMLCPLHGEYSRKFEDFRTIENEMDLISAKIMQDNAPSYVQLELIDMLFDAILVEQFNSGKLVNFYPSL